MNLLKILLRTALLSVVFVISFKLTPVHYRININELDLKHYFYYKNELEKIEAFADATDTIDVVIDSPGGYVFIGNQIMNMLSTTSAHVKVKVLNLAASGGAYIMLFGDEIYVNPYAKIMFHRAYYVDDNGAKVHLDRNDIDEVILMDISQEKLYQYLTEKEIAAFNAGEDVWLSGKEFMKRYNSLKSND